jgi:hypothetical protein
MEIAVWTAIGASLGLIAKGVSADKPLTQQEAQAKLDEVLAQLKKAREDLAAQEKEIKDKSKAAAEQEETVAEVTGVLKKRLAPAAAPPVDIAGAATVWSRAKADDIKQFAENRLVELRKPAPVNAIPVWVPPANAAGQQVSQTQSGKSLVAVVGEQQEVPPPISDAQTREPMVVGETPVEEQQQGPSSFDTSTATAATMPETSQLGKPIVGGAVATNREALYESLKNNWSEYSEVARKSLETFHSRYVKAWKLDNPGRELPAEEMLVPFANKVAEELNQIPIDRAARRNEEARAKGERDAAASRDREVFGLMMRLSNAYDDVVARKYDPTNPEIVDAMLRASDYLINPSLDARISEIRSSSGPINIAPYEFTPLLLRYPDEAPQWKEQIETRISNASQYQDPNAREEVLVGWVSENHIPGPLARPRASAYLDATTLDNVKGDVEQLVAQLESFPSLSIPNEAPAAGPAPVPKSRSSWFSRSGPAEEEEGPAPAAHNAILEEAPTVQKNAEAAIKTVKSSKSKLDAKIALLPTPHIYRGACAVKAVALRLSKLHEDVLRVLGKAAPVLKSDLAAYKKETKKLGVPIYDATLKPRTTTKESELAEKQEIVDDETERISGLAEGIGNQIRDLSLSKQGTLEAITSTKALKSLKAPNMTGGDMFDRTRDLYASLSLRIREISPLLAFVEGMGNGVAEVINMIDGIDRKNTIPKEEWEDEKRRCDKEMKDVMTRVDTVITRTAPVQIDTSQQGTFLTENPMAVKQAKQEEMIQAAKTEADKLAAAYPQEERDLRDDTEDVTASDLYTPNPPSSRQLTIGEANTSPFFRGVQEVQDWFNTVWAFASKEDKAKLETQRKEAMATLESAMTPSQRERARKKLAEKRTKRTGGAGEELTEEQKLAEKLYAGLLEGASRKRTLKNRRGGKQTQNGRGTRRGKNRADRSHPNSRRRT